MGLAETALMAVELGFRDRQFTAGMRNATGALGKFDSAAGRVGAGVGKTASGIARAGAIVGAGVVTGLGAATKAFIDYEDAFAGVAKTVEATPAQLDELNDKFRELSRSIPITSVEFARIGETAGALGINVDAIDEFSEVVAKLGVTTDLTSDAAADALGRIGNVLKITADDFDNFGSALVNLGNKGASTESEIIEITKRFAAAGRQAGISTTDILGLAEATASFTGLNPEAAGSSLSRFSGQLTKVVSGGGKKLKELNRVFGGSFRKAFDKDAGGALVRFFKRLGKLDKYERASFLKEMGLDSVYLRQLINGLTQNVDGLEQSLDNAEQGWRGNFLNEEAAKKFDTLKSRLQVLKNNLVDAGIELAEGFGPALERAAERLTAVLDQPENRAKLREIGEEIGDIIDKIDWDEVIAGTKTFVDTLKVAVDYATRILGVLNSLPTEVKAGGLGFLALDKLSGGMISSGLGGIAGGLASALTKSLAASIPIFGKAFVQPVFVTNMGPGLGGPGGKLPGAAGALPAGATLGGLALSAGALAAVSAAVAEGANRVFSTPTNKDPGFQAPQMFNPIPAIQNVAAVLGVIRDNTANPKDPPISKDTRRVLADVALNNQRAGERTVQSQEQNRAKTVAAVAENKRETTRGLNIVKATTQSGLQQNRAATAIGLMNARAATQAGAALGAGTARSEGASTRATIRANRPIVTTNVKVYVTGSSVTRTVSSTDRGSSRPSQGSGPTSASGV